jgi:hypothetical protein
MNPLLPLFLFTIAERMLCTTFPQRERNIRKEKKKNLALKRPPLDKLGLMPKKMNNAQHE